MNPVLFRVDAGEAIGLGHLQRSLALATALAEKGITSHFIVGSDEEAFRRIADGGFSGETLNGTALWGAGDVALVADAARHRGRCVIVDGSRKSPDYLRRLCEAGLLVVSIEDNSAPPLACHLVVNGNLHACRIDYRAEREGTEFLLGPEYSLLARDFWDLPPSRGAVAVRRILVTLGGSDPQSLTSALIPLIDTCDGDFAVTLIVGPYFDGVTEIEAAVLKARRDMQLVRSPVSLGSAIASADLAVTGGGQTLYQLARFGCPAVAIETAPDQRAQLAAFEEHGIIEIAGSGGPSGLPDSLRKQLGLLIADPNRRSAMGSRGRSLVDGQGARRVAERIIASTARIWERLSS